MRRKPDEVAKLFAAVTAEIGTPDLVVYNPSGRARGPIADLKPDEVLNAIMVGCYGGFLVGQQAARAMLKAGHGSILFTGASASVKGFPLSAAFAMGKFGLRGLTQSMARELAPQNIHVAHFVIDGGYPPARRHARCGSRSRRHVGAGRDRGELSRRPSPASQRLDGRDRIAAVGREVLSDRWPIRR